MGGRVELWMGVMATISTILLGWRQFALTREKATLERCTSSIDDLDQVRKALTEENERLRKRLEEAEKRILELKHELTV